MDPEQPPEGGGIILPTVARLIVCDEAYFDDDEGRWVIKEPWAVRFLGEGVEFPFQPAELWVYLELTGGLGPVRLGIWVDRTMDFRESPNPAEDFQPQYREVWARAMSEPYDFPSGGSRQVVSVASLPLEELTFPEEGAFEFRAFALADRPDAEPGLHLLEGVASEVFILDPTRSL